MSSRLLRLLRRPLLRFLDVVERPFATHQATAVGAYVGDTDIVAEDDEDVGFVGSLSANFGKRVSHANFIDESYARQSAENQANCK